MASIERSDNAEKVELEEIMSTEVAKSLIADAERRNEPSAIGQLRNNRGQTLRLLATTNWNGSFFTAPPTSVGAGDFIRFSHNGSSGAVIYGQQQQGSSNAAAYLVAWSMDRIPRNRKVYVKCGAVSEVHYNGWERAALTSLNSAGRFESSDRHDGTSSSVLARIDDATGSFPLSAIVGRFD